MGQEDTQYTATVIIPVKHGDRKVLDCLQRLITQECATPFEVLAILHPADPLIEEIRTRFPHVTAIPSGESGPGGGRNRGIEAAKGRYLVFTDADCLPRSDWLARMLAAARQFPGEAIAGWTEPADSNATGLASELFERGIPKPRQAVRIPGTWGSNMCVPRELLDASRSRFVEHLYGAEETALIAQLPPDKRRVTLVPDAVVIHDHHYRFSPAMRRMYRLGFGSGVVRSRYPVSGAFLARHRWLIPFLPAARLAILLKRILAVNPRAAGSYIALFPLLCCMAGAYTLGFASGTRPATQPHRPGALS